MRRNLPCSVECRPCLDEGVSWSGDRMTRSGRKVCSSPPERFPAGWNLVKRLPQAYGRFRTSYADRRSFSGAIRSGAVPSAEFKARRLTRQGVCLASPLFGQVLDYPERLRTIAAPLRDW